MHFLLITFHRFITFLDSVWAAYLTPHMITGTVCQHSHLFFLCREALWPDESKMLPASNKCSTLSPVTKHYKCSEPENGKATSCHKPKLQTSPQTKYKFCCLILPLVQQPAGDWQQLRIPCKVGPRHFCARGCWQLLILPKRRSGPGLCENAVSVLQDFASWWLFLKFSLENESRIQSGGINIAVPPESNS